MNKYLKYILTSLLVLSLMANLVLIYKYNDKKESYTQLKKMYDELFDGIVSE
ncbi:hypothetical protein [Paenibacillus lactis]|uniref:hypothetical protein n=1 Tax=Paenibacillus lactis TaxID=228574 RepID=UPI003D7448A9